MKDLVIVGASGFGKEVAWLVEEINRSEPTWRIVGFLDDNPARHGQPCVGYPVLGGTDWLQGRPGLACAIGIGEPRVRRKVAHRTAAHGAEFPALVHPTIRLHGSVRISPGVLICAGNILTVEIELGGHTHLNLNNTVGHGAVFGEFCTVYPGNTLSGDIVLEAGVSLGTGGSIIQGLRVGCGTAVGAGATVVRDLPPDVVAVGSPAKPIREITPRWADVT